jgi:hypothetical protein
MIKNVELQTTNVWAIFKVRILFHVLPENLFKVVYILLGYTVPTRRNAALSIQITDTNLRLNPTGAELKELLHNKLQCTARDHVIRSQAKVAAEGVRQLLICVNLAGKVEPHRISTDNDILYLTGCETCMQY